jgi:hypothetical protein
MVALDYKNPDLQMPPAGRLPDADLAKLERWIRAGAPWPQGMPQRTTDPATMTPANDPGRFNLTQRKAEHWCWKPLSQPTPPTVPQHPQAGPIDRFILAALQAKHLELAPPADRETWLRRVSFALIGLPPTPEHRESFLTDSSPQAEARVVDRLLASPHFGERWGRHWLDLVRYAESRGHEFDYDIPNIHLYRDYILEAFQQDLPYDQLVLEHLVGDILPQPRVDAAGVTRSIMGTAFWHLGEEVHSPIDLRQDQADRFDNRIDVFSKAFLGLTISCARCHDHKFDAISTQDYYALFTWLEGSSYRQARIDTQTREAEVQPLLAALHDHVAGTLESIAPPPRARPSSYGRAELIVDYDQHTPATWETDGPTFRHIPAGQRAFLQKPEGSWQVYEPTRGSYFAQSFWDRLEVAGDTAGDGHALNQLPRAGRTLKTPRFTLKRKSIYVLVQGAGMLYAPIHDHKILQGPLHGGLVKQFVAPEKPAWIELPLAGYLGQSFHLEITAKAKGPLAVFAVVQADEAPPLEENPARWRAVPPAQAEALTRGEAELAARGPWTSRLIPALWDHQPTRDQVMIRGNPRTPGVWVEPRGPEALFGTQTQSRLEFAKQLVDPQKNPLLDRVWVNRVWHHLFGRGLVASVDNFGVLGELPTHPELLDYLAQEFLRGGRRLKPFLKQLILTQVYRQSTRNRYDPADPANLWLHSFRLKPLEGEAIRDAMLQVSGVLDPTVGGRSVPIHLTPFLEGRGRPASGPVDGKNRRSLYLATRRNFLSPFLLSFDTPAPFSTVGRRQTSNVPAQALTLMNDPFVLQKAQQWGEKLASRKQPPQETIREAYLAAFGREPKPQELETAFQFLGPDPHRDSWNDLAHALFQMKEFRFVR